MILTEMEKIKIRGRKKTNDHQSWRWGFTFTGQRMAHNFYLYYMIDTLFSIRPEVQGVIELGTGSGALTTVLGLWGVKLGIPVLSVDRLRLYDKEIFKALRIQFVRKDFWDVNLIDLVRLWIRLNSPLLMIIDGGDKAREFNFWAPLLDEGSVIGVHDYGTEWDWNDIKRVATRFCHPINRRLWEKLNVCFATFGRSNENG